MRVCVVGANGVVGRSLVEHFRFLGHEVVEVDRNSPISLHEAAANCDVVCIVTLPISEIGILVHEAASAMRPEGLILHGTSIENPAQGPIDATFVKAQGVTLGHLHLHFRPEVPLRRTLHGQNVSLSLQGPEVNRWKGWVEDQFLPFLPVWHEFQPGDHDHVTSISQLIHMICSAVIGRLWSEIPQEVVKNGISIGGPPCQSLVRSVLRTSLGAKVLEEIILNHPNSLQVIDRLEKAIQALKEAISNRQTGTISSMVASARASLDEKTLSHWDMSTGRLARLEADLRATSLEFTFPADKNAVGLLAKTLHEFDVRGVDKTTTIAQTNPNGSCTFIVGVREVTEAVREAEIVIKSWL